MTTDPAFDNVSVPREHLQVLFDLATNSMDFGSGFWENSDVPPVRAIAVLLGVDPMDATPQDHRRHYPHACVSREPYHYEGGPVCVVCRRPAHPDTHEES